MTRSVPLVPAAVVGCGILEALERSATPYGNVSLAPRWFLSVEPRD